MYVLSTKHVYSDFITNAQVTASTFWNFNTTVQQKREIYANFSTHMDLLREITPYSGAYFVRRLQTETAYRLIIVTVFRTERGRRA